MHIMKKPKERAQAGFDRVSKQKGQEQEECGEQSGTILRTHFAIMCIYFLVLLLMVYITDKIAIFAVSMPCFFAYCLSFYMSYRIKPVKLLVFNYFLMTAFILGFVFMFGFNCGVQNFIFVMAALVFSVGNCSIRQKIMQTAMLCVLGIVLFCFTKVHQPLYGMTQGVEISFRIINLIVIFFELFSCFAKVSEDGKRMQEKMAEMAGRLKRFDSEDPLTGLVNRKSMMDYLEGLTGNRKEETNQGICVAVGDIDFFGKVNDKYGHDCGDIVLKQVAYQLMQFMADKGSVARWGGEEFLFVFDNVSGEDAYYYLTRLQQKIRGTEFQWEDESIRITMTYGLMEYNPDKSIDYCIVEADKKLLMGKESGRNTIIY